MKRKSSNGTNTAHKPTQKVRGTGKMSFKIFSSHKKHGSVNEPKPAKSVLDNRGPKQRAANFKVAKRGSKHGNLA